MWRICLMTPTNEIRAQHVDVIFHPAYAWVEEVADHTVMLSLS